MTARDYKAEGALRDVLPAVREANEIQILLQDDLAKVQAALAVAALAVAARDGGISEGKAEGICVQLAEASEALEAALELADEVVARELLKRWGRKS